MNPPKSDSARGRQTMVADRLLHVVLAPPMPSTCSEPGWVVYRAFEDFWCFSLVQGVGINHKLQNPSPRL